MVTEYLLSIEQLSAVEILRYHGSVPLIAEYDALRFMFDFYQMKFANKLFDSSFSADSSVNLLQQHFKKVSQQMNYTVLPPEQMVNGLAYGCLQNSQMDKAYAFFKMNVDNYPQSFNVYDSMKRGRAPPGHHAILFGGHYVDKARAIIKYYRD